MPRLSYDLHIHSCLSPCGDDDMTPANIVGMSALKELDIIAVTDHSSCKNCPPVLKIAEEYGIIAIPGMELTTLEEIHVLCLFENLNDAMAFDEYVYSQLLPFPNNEKIFGRQLIYGLDDSITGSVPNLLINATNISFDDVFSLTKNYGGIMLPAHIDKSANSLLSIYGSIPPDAMFRCAELSDISKAPALKEQHPYLAQCRLITNSDAHYLGDINEAINYIDVPGKKRRDILKALICPD